MSVCPVAPTRVRETERGPAAGPFFVRRDGSPLLKAFLMSRVRQALETLGVDPWHYAGHSFRIGAATAAARAGLEDSRHSVAWEVEQFSLPSVYPHTERKTGCLLKTASTGRW